MPSTLYSVPTVPFPPELPDCPAPFPPVQSTQCLFYGVRIRYCLYSPPVPLRLKVSQYIPASLSAMFFLVKMPVRPILRKSQRILSWWLCFALAAPPAPLPVGFVFLHVHSGIGHGDVTPMPYTQVYACKCKREAQGTRVGWGTRNINCGTILRLQAFFMRKIQVENQKWE